MSSLKRFISPENPKVAYAASLPERTLRSFAALAGGVTTFVTDTVLPEPVRQTTIYTVTVGMVQRFVIERVAQVEVELADDERELEDSYAQRKLAGNMLEAAGLLTVGFSPLWVFAIAGDVAGGSKLFLDRLVVQLKENGIIAEDVTINELVDVLEATQSASISSATAVDQPPLSREELSDLATELKASYAEAFKEAGDLLPELDDIWETMQQLAKRDDISFERLSGIMTGDVTMWSDKEREAVAIAQQTAADLFDEKILDSYRQTLAEISEQGASNYVSDHFEPFLQSAKSHYAPSQLSWTERQLLKQHIGSEPKKTKGANEL